jgi:predicted ATPase
VTAKPAIYVSYAFPDNKDGFVADFAKYLNAEMQVQTGEETTVHWPIDRTTYGAGWSDDFGNLNDADFLIAIVSPSYFRSDLCRKDCNVFLTKEQAGGSSLIFPVYYVETQQFEASASAEADSWIRSLRQRYHHDFRKFRFSLPSASGQRAIASLAKVIRDAHRSSRLSVRRVAAEDTLTANEPIYVESLELRNFRCFEQLNLRFDHASRLQGKWTCIAGINGAGKSSILQALSIALLGNPAAMELGGDGLRRMQRHVDLLNRLPAKVDVVLRAASAQPLPLRVEIDDVRAVPLSGSDRGQWDLLRKHVVVAYGATRNLSSRVDLGNERLSPDVRRQVTLFDPLSQLAGANVLLAQRNHDRTLVKLFETLFSQVFGPELQTSSGYALPQFSYDGVVFLLGSEDIVSALDLPDGFRAAAAWMADLCAAWCEKAPGSAESGDPADIQAIVLIDEIDLHLHPALQRELVPRLRKALPKVQWIVTTHSPLVLSNFDSSEIIALDRNEPSGVRFLDRQIMGFSANDIYEWLMGTPPRGAAIEDKLRNAKDPAEQREAAELLRSSPSVDDEKAKLSVEKMLARLEHLEK